jgi:uncharacterized protein (DUF2141 family)
MRVLSSPSLRETWLPAGLILAALAVFGVLAFRVKGDLRLVSPEIDPDLRRSPPAAAGTADAGGRAGAAGAKLDPGKPGRLVVHVGRVRNASGKVSVAVFDGGPLNGSGSIVRAQEVAASPEGSTAVFEGLPQGVYAVTAFHDEDGDGRLAMQPGRPPREGVGASSAGSPLSGPPRFEDAQFALDRDVVELEIELVYF